ncbi:carbohydrate kinase family protein [Actinomadura verrucosospora]|uniref:PfkB carbohydrate kinase family protein n=1 Tax=Actinomadura verrucosospora TaxID=46165 RepID=A0A7D4AV02_ACTVE|nr:carbohydrate kinase family protein [Actinomadura verrucosospora]QKG26448.1 pfkB carbohydrate kinase family protein [Actinomadura verrucosospora]
MRIAVTGSIATDHLMTFPGRFSDQLLPDQLDRVSLSFLVDELEIRRGGVAANICFGMGGLGKESILVGSVGDDFADYRSWLDRHGVDTASVHVSELHHTARFLCTTDQDQNQIASFYTGAMSEARSIELGPVADRVGGLDLVLISANDPEAMLRHTDECRSRGIPFAADPSQQLARMDGADVRRLLDGAAYLFSNEYEKALFEEKTGWSGEEVLSRVGIRVTTLGAKGAVIDRQGEEGLHVPCVPVEKVVDPTGVGDAFRSGFLSATAWGLPLERAAQVGSTVAAYALEAAGPQEYTLSRRAFLDRLSAAYGSAAAADVEPHLACPNP